MWWLIPVSIVASTAGALLIRSEYEKNHLRTTSYTITDKDLPEEFDGYTVVFLSDLHHKTFGDGNETLVRMVKNLHPDLVLFGGDMITAGKHSQKIRFASLQSLLDGLTGVPVLYGFGNHETRVFAHPDRYAKDLEAFRKMIESRRVTVLSDSRSTIRKGDSAITVSCFDLPRDYYKKGAVRALPETLIEEHLGEASPFEILLLHSPLYMDKGVEWGAKLVLSGHFHGGTIYLGEKLGGLMTPQFQFFEKKVRGRFRFENGFGVVSAGLGTHSVNVRLNDYPEIVRIVLKKGKHGTTRV